MVTRILVYELATPESNATDEEVDTMNPPGDRTWDVQGLYGNTESTNDYSVVLNERKLIDNIPGDELADEDNVLPVNMTVQDGDDLTVLNTDDGSQNRAAVYVIVDES